MQLAVSRSSVAVAPAPSSRTGEVFTTEWPDYVLDGLRQEGDERWDGLWRTMDRQTFERLLGLDLRNDEPLPADLDLPRDVVRFFAETGQLPAWAEPERIRRAQALFSRHGLPIVTILLCASLPKCYAAVRGASILGLSTQLRDQPERRVLQTAQFLLDVMAPGGLEAGGRGIRRTQQVRLLHIVCRHGFLRVPGYRPEWGLPLNQEDLLGTLMSFSAVVLDALPRLGIDLTAEEEEDYLHAWQVIGHVLGIRDDQLPADPSAARGLVQQIEERHFALPGQRNPAGQALAQALVGYMQDRLPLQVFDGYIPTLMRHLIGDDVADSLGIPRGDWTRVFIGAGRAAARVADALGDGSVIFRAPEQWLGRRLLELAYAIDTDGQPQHFSVHPELMTAWRLRRRGAATTRG